MSETRSARDCGRLIISIHRRSCVEKLAGGRTPVPETEPSSAFSLFGLGASRFQFPCSPVLCFFYLYLFRLHACSYNITPPPFRCSYLSVSTTSVLINISSSVFLSTWPNHLSHASLISSLVFATPALDLISSFLIFSILFISIIHLNILIAVPCSKYCSCLRLTPTH